MSKSAEVALGYESLREKPNAASDTLLKKDAQEEFTGKLLAVLEHNGQEEMFWSGLGGFVTGKCFEVAAMTVAISKQSMVLSPPAASIQGAGSLMDSKNALLQLGLLEASTNASRD